MVNHSRKANCIANGGNPTWVTAFFISIKQQKFKLLTIICSMTKYQFLLKKKKKEN